jgi:predicted enzyme related to lactoylglutathione lyase
MFERTRAFSGFAVDDIDAAERFYGEVLGLPLSRGENGLLTLHIEGGAETIIYPKPDYVPAGFTILNFPVQDIEAAIAELGDRGVELIRYDGMGQDEQGIMRAGGPLIGWFNDPAGNILAVLEL